MSPSERLSTTQIKSSTAALSDVVNSSILCSDKSLKDAVTDLSSAITSTVAEGVKHQVKDLMTQIKTRIAELVNSSDSLAPNSKDIDLCKDLQMLSTSACLPTQEKDMCQATANNSILFYELVTSGLAFRDVFTTLLDKQALPKKADTNAKYISTMGLLKSCKKQVDMVIALGPDALVKGMLSWTSDSDLHTKVRSVVDDIVASLAEWELFYCKNLYTKSNPR